MKHRIQITALALVACLLAGCTININIDTTPSAAETTNPAQSATPSGIPAIDAGYEAVYEDICTLMTTGDQERTYRYSSAGIVEAALGDTPTERFAEVAYALQDLTGDDIAEMIVLNPLWPDNGGSRILAIYTLQENSPIMIAEGWSRSRLYLLPDQTFYTEGSSGATYSHFGLQSLKGDSLHFTTVWFTEPKGDAQTQLGFYYNTAGVFDAVSSQEITQEEYCTQQDDLFRQVVVFSHYSFN